MEHHPANQPLVAAYAGEGTSQHSTYLLESVWSFIATRDVVVEQALSILLDFENLQLGRKLESYTISGRVCILLAIGIVRCVVRKLA